MKKLEREKYLTEDEFRRLLQAIRTRVRMTSGGGTPFDRRRKGEAHPHMARDYALFATSGLTGIREHELVGFRVGDLRGVVGETREERPARLRVRRAKKKDPRTGGPIWEEIALPETARLALVEYLRTLDPESKEPHSRVFPLSTRQVRTLFKYYARRAGLSAAYSAHALRHTRGMILAAKFKDVKLVQQALGHAKLETAAIYIHTVGLDEKLAGTDIAE